MAFHGISRCLRLSHWFSHLPNVDSSAVGDTSTSGWLSLSPVRPVRLSAASSSTEESNLGRFWGTMVGSCYQVMNTSMGWQKREHLNRKPSIFPWDLWDFPVIFPLNQSIEYPPVMTNIAMENGHLQWKNHIFLWPFSIAMLNYQRVAYMNHRWNFPRRKWWNMVILDGFTLRCHQTCLAGNWTIVMGDFPS